MAEREDLSFLRGEVHECGAECREHRAGIQSETNREVILAEGMAGVREYAEGYKSLAGGEEMIDCVDLVRIANGRIVVRAFNEGGHNVTEVDLLDLLRWLRENRPEFLKEATHARS